jgi:transcriptional regulator EpsA
MDRDNKTKEWDTDLPLIIRIFAKADEVTNVDELLSLLKTEVMELLHHEAMVCGYHVLSAGGNYVHNVLQYNYPEGYVASLAATEGRADSPLMQRWRLTHEPVFFQSGRDEDAYPADWVDLLKKYGLHNIIGHGVLDVRGTFGSYFVFARLPGEIDQREILLLKLITPHLHLALMRTVASDQQLGELTHPDKVTLSARQQEIMRWIYQGKTNKEIALLLSTTERNVNYHIEKIFTKLGVRSRAQAVSKAILRGL